MCSHQLNVHSNLVNAKKNKQNVVICEKFDSLRNCACTWKKRQKKSICSSNVYLHEKCIFTSIVFRKQKKLYAKRATIVFASIAPFIFFEFKRKRLYRVYVCRCHRGRHVIHLFQQKNELINQAILLKRCKLSRQQQQKKYNNVVGIFSIDFIGKRGRICMTDSLSSLHPNADTSVLYKNFFRSNYKNKLHIKQLYCS